LLSGNVAYRFVRVQTKEDLRVLNETSEQLTSGRRIARNVSWNITGNIAPLLLALVALPLLIDGLGTARAGVLFLIWTVLNYFNLFQFGLGRALTKFIAERLGEGNEREVSSLVWTGTLLMVILGVIATVSMYLLAPWLVHHQLKVPEELREETVQAFYVFGLAMPAIISVAAFKSVLEAYQRFGLKNGLQVALGILNYAGLLFIVLFSQNLVPLSWFVAAGALLAWIVHLVVCARVAPTILRDITFSRSVLGPLVTFGGWDTVRSLVQPIIMYSDRFFIGSLVSVAAVAYYTTAYEVVTKLWVLPTSLVGVVFPAMAMSLVQDRSRAKRIYEAGVKICFLALYPAVLLCVLFAKDVLLLWLGAEFAEKSTAVFQITAIMILVNSLAHVPMTTIVASGRPDVTAKLSIIEAIILVPTMWWAVDRYGIVGAAVASLARVALDTVCGLVLAKRVIPETDGLMRSMTVVLVGATLTILGAYLPQSVEAKGLYFLACLAAFLPVAWVSVLEPAERAFLLRCPSYFGWSWKRE
jgi:O-antigen/teichoic acid export membrane protein